jgi:hypothetical protein
MKNRCNEKDISQRGPGNPQQQQYANTVADYSGLTPPGDNVKISVACEVTVSVGDAVRMDNLTAVKAIATSFLGSNVVGIVTSKPSSEVCDITICGPVNGALGSLDTSKQYFLSDSTPGELVNTPPTTSGSYVIRIGNAINSTTLAIHLERVVKRI